MPALQTLLDVLEWVLRVRGARRREMPVASSVLSYLEMGRGTDRPTLVLVHGLGSSGLSWAKVVGPLARRWRVLVPDLPGWGRSPLPPGRDHATIHELTQALVQFLAAAGGGAVVLVGQSLGGWVSAKVAATRPDLVRHLVLCNSAGVLYPEVAELKAKLDVKNEADVETFWRNLWHRVPAYYRFFTDDYVAKMHEPRVLNFFESIQEESLFVNQDLAKITMPTTIIWGLSDRFIPKKTVDVLAAGLPDVTIHWVPECGHIPALERPREFVRILRAAVLAEPA